MTTEINSTRSEENYNLRIPKLGEDTCRLTAGWSSIELSSRVNADDETWQGHILELS